MGVGAVKGHVQGTRHSVLPEFLHRDPKEIDGSFNFNVKPPGFCGIGIAELAFMLSRVVALSNDQVSRVTPSPPLGQTSVPCTKTPSNEPALSAGPEDTASRLGGSTFQTGTMAIRIKESFHWCATFGVLLILQLIFDSIGQKFQYVPLWSNIHIPLCRAVTGSNLG